MTKIISKKSNVDLDYPVVRPSLDLDFTQEELDPRITFSRGSIGTRVNRNRLIETVDANQPRFDYDPVTGECKGLLIEESRVNYAYPSIYPGVGPNFWTNVIQNSNTSPDGTFTAVNYIWRNPAGCYGSYIPITNTAGIPYTGSCFIKPNDNKSSSCVQIGRNDSAVTARCVFSHSTKTVSVTSSAGVTNASASITPFPNGWYRISVTATFTSSYGNFALFFVALNNNGNVYTWGFQLEQGAFPTSYIPTTASTVTRSAELADMTGSNFSSWYNQTEGTFVFDGTLPFITNDILTTGNSARVPFGVSNGLNFSNSMYVSKGTTSLGISFSVINNNVGQVQGNNTITTMTSSRFKISAAFADKNIYLSGYGGAINKPSKPTAAIPIVNRLTLGKEPWNVSPGNPIIGCITRFTYYPRALKPAQLQYLTQ